MVRHGKPEAGKILKQTSVALPMPLWERAKIYAVKNGMEFRAVVWEALDEYLRRRGS